MSIIKNKLKREYSQIPNEIVIDTTIGAGAFRVLVYLYSKPDEWNVYNKDICKQLEISEKTLTKYWKQLLVSKWLRREKQLPTSENAGGYVYHIGSFSISEQCSTMDKTSEHSNTKPIKKELTNNNELENFILAVKKRVKLKSKVTKTKEGEKLFKQIEDKDKLLEDYVAHHEDKKEYAKRLTPFMEDYTIDEVADWKMKYAN